MNKEFIGKNNETRREFLRFLGKTGIVLLIPTFLKPKDLFATQQFNECKERSKREQQILNLTLEENEDVIRLLKKFLGPNPHFILKDPQGLTIEIPALKTFKYLITSELEGVFEKLDFPFEIISGSGDMAPQKIKNLVEVRIKVSFSEDWPFTRETGLAKIWIILIKKENRLDIFSYGVPKLFRIPLRNVAIQEAIQNAFDNLFDLLAISLGKDICRDNVFGTSS